MDFLREMEAIEASIDLTMFQKAHSNSEEG